MQGSDSGSLAAREKPARLVWVLSLSIRSVRPKEGLFGNARRTQRPGFVRAGHPRLAFTENQVQSYYSSCDYPGNYSSSSLHRDSGSTNKAKMTSIC